MQTVTLYLPKKLKRQNYGNDLEEIIADYNGKRSNYFAFPLAYAVGLAQVYEFPSRNNYYCYHDINIFCDEALRVPGRLLWYNAFTACFKRTRDLSGRFHDLNQLPCTPSIFPSTFSTSLYIVSIYSSIEILKYSGIVRSKLISV